MRISQPATRRRHVLGLALAGVVLFLLANCRPVRADLIFLKDGFAVEGRVKREMTVEFDKIGGEMIHMPKGFFLIDDGPRRIFFSPSQVRLVYPKDPPIEERIVCGDWHSQVNAKRMPEILEVLRPQEWDAKWHRRFRFRAPVTGFNGGTVVHNEPQHIGLLTPYWARADSPGHFFWSCAYLTREFGPETVQALLATHPDFQDKKDMAAVPRVSRRLRKADFYAQAGWLDLAEQELDRTLADLPDQKERIEAARKTLANLRARDRVEEMKRRHLAGQHRLVRKMLGDFSFKNRSEKMISEVQELNAEYENTDRLLAETARLLEKARSEAAGGAGQLLVDAAFVIAADLNFENVGRLDAFLGQARQAERLQKRGKKSELGPVQLLSLAVSGWLMGSASAEVSPETAERLWRGREMLVKYLRTEDENERQARVRAHLRGSRLTSASMDELIQIIRTLPPVEAEKNLPEGITEIKAGGATYSLQLPPEYRPGRKYPLLIVLHNSGEGARDMLNRWAEPAAEHGYLLAAPEWQGAALNGGYTYSEREHRIVLDMLRDLRRRFNVDEDRVFLFGLGEGGAMAFDVGLGHPDLFAGVMPMGAGPRFNADVCWRNGQYLPFYVMHGNRGPNGDRIRGQFELWVQRNYPMLWVDYKGRGIEWFAGEVPNMFDWMRGQKRPFPLRQLGTDGGYSKFGNEFCTLRACDNHFYWLSTDDVRSRNSAERWNNRIQPASLFAVISRESNHIRVKTSGLGNVTIWLGRNERGEDMIDFDKPVTVYSGLAPVRDWINRKVTPSVEVMLEDLYERGDRQHLFFAKIPIQLAAPRRR